MHIVGKELIKIKAQRMIESLEKLKENLKGTGDAATESVIASFEDENGEVPF